jgi:hypothetical protein
LYLFVFMWVSGFVGASTSICVTAFIVSIVECPGPRVVGVVVMQLLEYHRIRKAIAGHPLTSDQQDRLAALAPLVKTHVKQPRKSPCKNSSSSSATTTATNNNPTAAAAAAVPAVITNVILKEEVEYVRQKVDDRMDTARSHSQ